MTTYGKIENEQFISAPYNEVEDLISQGYLAFDESDVANYFAGLSELSDGTNTAKRLVSVYNERIQSQIDDLDKKRIRAGFEPSVKDETTGQTWLDYYTSQILDLRAQIVTLNA